MVNDSKMIVAEIYIYPIKSCRGIQLQEAEVTPKGFLWDREFMLVDSRGKFLTQRQHANLARIQVQLAGDLMALSVEDCNLNPFLFKPTLTGREIEVEIWRDRTPAIDQGDEVAEWFHSALELDSDRKYRLVRQSPSYIRSIDKNYAVREGEPVSFADGYPFLMTATASLAELNRRIKKSYKNESQEVPMNRFRPNIVVNTSEPFIEGNWKYIQIGSVQFAVVKPCSRCIITTTDQLTGKRNELQEPLKTLSTFRQLGNQGIMFGENMIPRTTGILRVGEEVQIL